MIGFLRTLRQYWENPKGRHDIKDYGQALFIIMLTAVFAVLLLRMVFHE